MIITYKNKTPEINDDAFIAPDATIIGDVKIEDNVGVWFKTVIRGDVNFIKIGSGTNVQDGTVIHVSRLENGQTEIGRNVTIGHCALIHACTLEDGCFIGMKSAVLDGAVVEKGAMVAAGALVPPKKRIPSGELWAGCPAKFMRKLNETDIENFNEINKVYLSLKSEYEEMNF